MRQNSRGLTIYHRAHVTIRTQQIGKKILEDRLPKIKVGLNQLFGYLLTSIPLSNFIQFCLDMFKSRG